MAATSGRTGRRPGDSGTRTTIARTAAALFAEQGYEKTSLRGIAAAAGVDAALVSHYFGSKQELFVAVTEPPEVVDLIPDIVAGDPAVVGRKVAEVIVGLLDDPDGRARVLGLVRAAASEPQAAVMVRSLIVDRVLGPVARRLDLDEPELRASLAGSQVVGLVMARYVVGVPPLAQLPASRLVELLTPIFHHWFTEPLDG